jgi:acyl-CoA dehydrogenase
MLGFTLTAEQEALKQTARDFARNEIIPVAAEFDEKEEFPHELMRKAWEVGLLNFEIPESYGGLGLGVLDTILCLEEINYGCAGVGTICAVNDLAATPLLLAGNDEQKTEYFGRLMSEPCFAAYALTEPGAGSDAANLSTTYVEDGDSYVLNGSKVFISSASVSNWMTLFATKDKSLGHRGISCFVMDTDTPGCTTTKMKGKLGHRASDTSEVVFEDCRIPKKALVGAEGEGFKIAMRTFDRTRPQILGVSIGVTQRALDECKRYSLERKAFGQPIANFQALQFMMADMAVDLEAMRLLTYKSAWQIDHGDGPSILSSYAKVFGADRAMHHTINAVQIFGGYGYMKEYPVEKLMRDAKLVQIYEGTSQIQRIKIARDLLKD